MKKLAILLIAMVGFVAVANAQQDRARVPGDENNMVFVSVSSDSQTSSTITFYNNSTKTITVNVSVYNDQNKEIGSGSYTVPGAPSQGNHSESTYTLNKIRACSGGTDGCETKSIKITSVK